MQPVANLVANPKSRDGLPNLGSFRNPSLRPPLEKQTYIEPKAYTAHREAWKLQEVNGTGTRLPRPGHYLKDNRLVRPKLHYRSGLRGFDTCKISGAKPSS